MLLYNYGVTKGSDIQAAGYVLHSHVNKMCNKTVTDAENYCVGKKNKNNHVCFSIVNEAMFGDDIMSHAWRGWVWGRAFLQCSNTKVKMLWLLGVCSHIV